MKRYNIIHTQSRGEVVIESASGNFVLKRLEKNVEVDKQAKENEQKARAWDKLYERITGRSLVHVNVDLDDIEERMDKLLAQEEGR